MRTPARYRTGVRSLVCSMGATTFGGGSAEWAEPARQSRVYPSQTGPQPANLKSQPTHQPTPFNTAFPFAGPSLMARSTP